MSLQPISSQTIGPFFAVGLHTFGTNNLAGPGVAGERITVRGRVLDGDGAPVSDALIEIWQANSQGKYAHWEDSQEKAVEPNFRGWGRICTDSGGNFSFTTIKPGRVPGPGGKLQAPHIVVVIFARGVLKHLITRIYFPNEPSNTEDAILDLVPAERRGTMIPKRAAEKDNAFEWNIVLQGDEETVFLDY